jgi:hypothetical protein
MERYEIELEIIKPSSVKDKNELYNIVHKIDDILDSMLDYKKPILIHCLVESTKCLPFVPSTNSLDDIIIN